MSPLKKNLCWIVGIGFLTILSLVFLTRSDNHDELAEDVGLSINTGEENFVSEDTSARFFPTPGTRWVYSGKRVYYDIDEQKTKEVTAYKYIDAIEIASEGDNVRLSVVETYINDPDFSTKEKTYLFSENGFAFKNDEVVNFPLTVGQRLSNHFPERNDGYYDAYVVSKEAQEWLGQKYTCYGISNHTSSAFAVETFCVGLGYVRYYYQHHGTPNESDYRLIRLVNTRTPSCPDDFTSSEARTEAMNAWTNAFFDENPAADLLDWSADREEYLKDKNCIEALDRLTDAKNGEADPETMEIINRAINQY